ncbi:DUF6894 family protein [Methylobacterium sp. WSM2598]|uniref:DUF6894 family protein n=1 Tax=Methylobacterium sp. WSM2598 TaxID=398261 RepID=UPI00035E3FEF|nr:hypothetical protein [Methylobacterium sp. WSM2598]
MPDDVPAAQAEFVRTRRGAMGADLMQRFYVDLSDGRDLIRDEEGVEAASLEEVLDQAERVIAETLLGDDPDDRHGNWTLVIRSAAGAILAMLPFLGES